MSQVEKKIKFIKAWYNTECTKLSFGDRLKLARIWIDICLKDEEYEMAAAIKEERQNVIKQHIKDKRKKRRFSQKFVVWIYLCNRKVSAWIKSKLSK
jgi:hypothetical protein